jgi:hypothetical protein
VRLARAEDSDAIKSLASEASSCYNLLKWAREFTQGVVGNNKRRAEGPQLVMVGEATTPSSSLSSPRRVVGVLACALNGASAAPLRVRFFHAGLSEDG